MAGRDATTACLCLHRAELVAREPGVDLRKTIPAVAHREILDGGMAMNQKCQLPKGKTPEILLGGSEVTLTYRILPRPNAGCESGG